MSWKERMYAGIGEYLRSEGRDCVEVIGIEEDVSVSGPYGCDTCGPDYDTEFSVSISYKDSKGKWGSYWYNGTFVSFINHIT